MARIDKYPKDETVDGDDRILGTDAEGTITKTYSVKGVAEWIKYRTTPITTLESYNGTEFRVAVTNNGEIQGIPLDSAAPNILSQPTISGTLNVAETLTVATGTVTGIPTPTTAFQWQRSNDGITSWVDIAGATGISYLLGFNDEDKYIRAAQTEENILGSATANSVSTTRIGPAVFSGLLDDYPNAAAAYSLRKLRNFYTGDAIVVRRASDNTTRSIGFDALTNELDTASLESFCVGTDGFVTTWFDQSGNNPPATQSIASKQPKIVSNGTFLGYIENNQANATILTTFGYSLTAQAEYVFFNVCQNYGNAIFISSQAQYASVAQNNTNTSANGFIENLRYKNGVVISNTWGAMYNATINFSLISAYVTPTSGTSEFSIGNTITSYNFSRFKEIVIYADNTIDRAGVQSNIIENYGF